MSEKPSPDEAAILQRRLASQANNRAWTLAESLSRTPECGLTLRCSPQAVERKG